MKTQSLPELTLLKRRQVLCMVPVCASTLKRWIKAGHFPAGVLASRGMRLWTLDEVLAWRTRVLGVTQAAGEVGLVNGTTRRGRP